MKLFMLSFIVALLLISCGNTPDNVFDVKDSIEIVVDKYDADTRLFTPTILQLNEPVVVKHTGNGMENINIQLCLEGGEFTVIADNKDVQLSIDSNRNPWRNGQGEREFGNTFQVGDGGYFCVYIPTAQYGSVNLAKHPAFEEHLNTDVDGNYIGEEYYVTIKAYKNMKHLVTAQLKFTQIRDANTDMRISSGDFTIELLSYQYSFLYDMM